MNDSPALLYTPFGAFHIKTLLESRSLRLSKDRGQNYLINKATAEKIINALPPLKERQKYFEVGTGLGALTVILAEKGPTLALEIDKGIYGILQDLFPHPNLTLIHGDFLARSFPKTSNYLFISNLPYSISGEALKVFIEEPCFNEGIVMLQKEFADRLSASETSSSYGPLSVIAQTFLKIEPLFSVGKGNFFPLPKVESLVVYLKKKHSPLHQKEFSEFVKTLFLAKRKTLANNIARSPWKDSALASYDLAHLRPDALPVSSWEYLFTLKTMK